MPAPSGRDVLRQAFPLSREGAQADHAGVTLASRDPHDPALVCGEIDREGPSVSSLDWFIEGSDRTFSDFEISHLFWDGIVTLETRVWSCSRPGWRQLGGVWEMRHQLPVSALPPDPWTKSRLDYCPGLRAWIARRRSDIRAWRIHLFDPHLYRCGYRSELEWLWSELVERPSPNRNRLVRQWWRRAGLPPRSWTEPLRAGELGSALRIARERDGGRAPGWLRAKLAGVYCWKPPLWVSLGRRVLAALSSSKARSPS